MKLMFLPVSQLKPIQSEVNRDKIESLKANPEKLANPIIVSKGGLILDGHHRFMAAKELDPNAKIPCLVAFCDINKLVALGHEFDGSFVKTVDESTIYSRMMDEDEQNIALLVRKPLSPWSDKLDRLKKRRGEIEE